MTNKKELVEQKYYENFNELIDNLSVIRPNDTKLYIFKGFTSSYVAFYGVSSLIQNMNNYVKNYTKEILKKDENFFINELKNDFNDDSFIADEISKIKDIWLHPETTIEQKNIIWKHFIIFAKLSKLL